MAVWKPSGSRPGAPASPDSLTLIACAGYRRASRPAPGHLGYDPPSVKHDSVRPRLGTAATVALTTVALLAFAANSLLCRAALRPGLVDAASFTSVRRG